MHSRKPDCVRDRIERLVGGPYLELFARETKANWDSLGNQNGLFDQGTVLTRRQARLPPPKHDDAGTIYTCPMHPEVRRSTAKAALVKHRRAKKVLAKAGPK